MTGACTGDERSNRHAVRPERHGGRCGGCGVHAARRSRAAALAPERHRGRAVSRPCLCRGPRPGGGMRDASPAPGGQS
jgi:hypothetical protein